MGCPRCSGVTLAGNRCRRLASCRAFDGSLYCNSHVDQAGQVPVRTQRMPTQRVRTPQVRVSPLPVQTLYTMLHPGTQVPYTRPPLQPPPRRCTPPSSPRRRTPPSSGTGLGPTPWNMWDFRSNQNLILDLQRTLNPTLTMSQEAVGIVENFVGGTYDDWCRRDNGQDGRREFIRHEKIMRLLGRVLPECGRLCQGQGEREVDTETTLDATWRYGWTNSSPRTSPVVITRAPPVVTAPVVISRTAPVVIMRGAAPTSSRPSGSRRGPIRTNVVLSNLTKLPAGCVNMRHLKKYRERPGPPYPGNKCRDVVMLGNDHCITYLGVVADRTCIVGLKCDKLVHTYIVLT